jgi:hypothetical protein
MKASLFRWCCGAVLWLAGCASQGAVAPATGPEAAVTEAGGTQAGGTKPRAQSEVVAEASALVFHSGFWPNLHHVLYAEAWARRGGSRVKSLAGAFPTALQGTLTEDERAGWEQAVAYYDRELTQKDLLFDPTMDAARQALLTADQEQPPEALPAEHRVVLAAAAPAYRKHWWPAHDRANREWIEQAVTAVQSLSPAVPDRLAGLYETPWFTSPVRVDVVFVGNRQGAYTALDPAPAHITIASTDRDTQGWAAAELVFHEASHALVRPIRDAFVREAESTGASIGPLWHVALFELTGEVVRQALAKRGVEYVPYLYATGLFDRAWPGFKEAIQQEWRRYVHGEVGLEEAVKDVVAACCGVASIRSSSHRPRIRLARRPPQRQQRGATNRYRRRRRRRRRPPSSRTPVRSRMRLRRCR